MRMNVSTVAVTAAFYSRGYTHARPLAYWSHGPPCTTGLLSKGESFRLIVSGKIGKKEIERLIKKLELDKEILAEQESETEGDEAAH
jgi:hypothetical protein